MYSTSVDGNGDGPDARTRPESVSDHAASPRMPALLQSITAGGSLYPWTIHGQP